jgi:tyrosyl-tRNA synthetase
MNIDETKVEELLSRGVENIIPSRDFLQKELLGGKKLKIYNGIDPTGPTLHIGHAIVLKKLKQFQDLGHKVVLLMGDFTALIGDPTDKKAVRKMLTEKEVKKNMALYQKQAATFLNFSGKNKAEIVFNSKWLKKLGLKEMINLMSLETVNHMIKRDMFDKRLSEGGSVYMHEFLYPLLQGYDSVALDVDVEIGGNDQMFNMLVGRDLLKKLKNKEKTTITMKLLADTTGKKMGKTEGNMVSLMDDNFNMFGKIMSWTDDMILNGFELCTNISNEELNAVRKEMSSDVNPRDLKIRLAKEIVSVYHGAAKAQEAEDNFIQTFSNSGIPENIEELSVAIGDTLGAALVSKGIVESNSDFKRIVMGHAVNIVGGEEIKVFGYKITKVATF